MEIKDKIIYTSFTMFRKLGIRSVSMDDIAQEMGVSKKTIYKWYETKDAIVQAAIQKHLDHTQHDCEEFSSKSKNAIDELFQTMDMLRQMFSGIHPSIFYDLQKFHPRAWQLVLEHKSGFILCQIVNNMKRGIAEGLYRPDLDVELMSRLRLAQLDIVFNPDVFPPEKFNIERVQLACLEHYMLGIATLKGHRLINKYKHITEEE